MALCYYLSILILFADYYSGSVFCTKYVDKNKPLILTPYIKSNQIEEAKKLSQVHFDQFQGVRSYSGYFTVNEKFNSNLFFWFFPSENNWLKDPVLLWLQGGPGLPSMYGLLNEHGPFSMTGDKISKRYYRWSKNHSVLYIDNPVGTGFSYTNGGYATNQTQIGKELHEALSQFFTLFKEIKKNNFYVIGESYAGKFVTSLCHTIHDKNPTSDVFINLNGLVIHDGYVDPVNQMDFGEFYYQLGLIDSFYKDQLDKVRDDIIRAVNEGDLSSASNKSVTILEIIKNQTAIASVYNYLLVTDENSYYHFDGDWVTYLNKQQVKKAVHVGTNITFWENREIVAENLAGDDMVSVAPWLSELLDHYPVLLFSGQLDAIVPYVSTINYLKKLKFKGAEAYKREPRFQWKVGEEVAGYCKKGGLMTECLVRNAGHLVPFDQPKYALDLIYKFVRNINLSS